MSVDQELKWKREYGDFRNTLPGYARSGFSRFQGELVYLSARKKAQEELESLEKEVAILRSALEEISIQRITQAEVDKADRGHDYDDLDHREGYESCVKFAREALSKSEVSCE